VIGAVIVLKGSKESDFAFNLTFELMNQKFLVLLYVL